MLQILHKEAKYRWDMISASAKDYVVAKGACQTMPICTAELEVVDSTT